MSIYVFIINYYIEKDEDCHHLGEILFIMVGNFICNL